MALVSGRRAIRRSKATFQSRRSTVMDEYGRTFVFTCRLRGVLPRGSRRTLQPLFHAREDPRPSGARARLAHRRRHVDSAGSATCPSGESLRAPASGTASAILRTRFGDDRASPAITWIPSARAAMLRDAAISAAGMKNYVWMRPGDSREPGHSAGLRSAWRAPDGSECDGPSASPTTWALYTVQRKCRREDRLPARARQAHGRCA